MKILKKKKNFFFFYEIENFFFKLGKSHLNPIGKGAEIQHLRTQKKIPAHVSKNKWACCSQQNHKMIGITVFSNKMIINQLVECAFGKQVCHVYPQFSNQIGHYVICIPSIGR